MNFTAGMRPVPRHAEFDLDAEGFYVWCGTMTQGDDGKYYLYFSFWPKQYGHDAWVTHSQVGYAVSESMLGPFHYAGIALSGSGGNGWDRDVIHNPSVIRYKGMYYLYYMGNYGDGTFWDHRNHQRIGVAWSANPEGPWHRSDRPLIDVTPGEFDGLCTNNPTVTWDRDGHFVMIYKAVSADGPMPKGGAVTCGEAEAESPLGPFRRYPKPVMQNAGAKRDAGSEERSGEAVPEADWSVEDPYIWFQGGFFRALAKDFHGNFTGAGENTMALLYSKDGISWKKDPEHPFAFRREIRWEDGTVTPLDRMERPQLFLDEKGIPRVLLCACMPDSKRSDCFNVQIPCEIIAGGKL
jgi:hypothetical protein